MMEEHDREQTAPVKAKRKGGGTWWKVLLAVVLTLAVSAGAVCLLLGRDGLALMQGYFLAKFAFVETDADLKTATDQALDALVSGLGDRWSYYRDEEGYKAMQERRANNYVGVGVTVTYDREEGLYVQDVTAGGPAEAAGVVAGDIIIAADGQSIAGDARYDGSDLIRGEEGTQVELTLLGADGTTRTVTCTRATLRNPSASGKMLDNQIGYVQLSNFYSGAADSFREEVDRLVEQGAVGLVIDLRNNPGGYIDELTEILDYLLPEGDVFRLHPRWRRETVYKSDADCVDLPFVTIVNGDSYSAAELLAAELREFSGSPVVGTKTSGKGYSQVTFALLNGGAVGLSTATYCTGEGHSLIGEGITPDVELELSETEDNQLAAAVALLTDG
jgi:carboxyl-terminal processing protease